MQTPPLGSNGKVNLLDLSLFKRNQQNIVQKSYYQQIIITKIVAKIYQGKILQKTIEIVAK